MHSLGAERAVSGCGAGLPMDTARLAGRMRFRGASLASPGSPPGPQLTTRQFRRSSEDEVEAGGDGGKVLAGVGEPAEAEGEDAEGAAIGAFEEGAEAMLEDEGALSEDEAGRE